MNSKVSVGTITRTALLILALINQVLTIMGRPVIALDNETVTQFISLAATIATSLWAWWKNNSFTAAALAGDEAMNKYREEHPDGSAEK